MDLVLTDCEEDIVNIDIINNIKLSDHNIIVTKMNYDTEDDDDDSKEHFYSTVHTVVIRITMVTLDRFLPFHCYILPRT